MFTRIQTLNRLDEIVEFAKTIPETAIDMSWWYSTLSADCGTVACIVGWLGIKQMFGMKLLLNVINDGTRQQVEASEPIPKICENYIDSVPVDVHGNVRYDAVTHMLFGDTGLGSDYREIMVRIADNLFASVMSSDYDTFDDYWEGDTQNTDKHMFLKRITKVRNDINELYDLLESEVVPS